MSTYVDRGEGGRRGKVGGKEGGGWGGYTFFLNKWSVFRFAKVGNCSTWTTSGSSFQSENSAYLGRH